MHKFCTTDDAIHSARQIRFVHLKNHDDNVLLLECNYTFLCLV